MLNLKGNNLGKRQQELNEEVVKTTSENVDFNVIRTLEERSDVDRLYKIDVASVYKNIDYLIETLKCGDSLYISRALKCAWLFENQNSFIINPDYLHHEVLPFMSIKMKKKLLTTISMRVRDEKRAEEFYKYCLTDNIFKTIATKFLIWTSEQYKIEYISCDNNIDDIKLEHLIGLSFNLAEVYLTKERSKYSNTNEKVHELRYLSNISNEKYLDLMEKFTDTNTHQQNISKLGLRLSKEVITKHKERVFNDVDLYFKKLNLDMIAKHSSVADIKVYAVDLLPPTATGFWSMNFYNCYKKIFNISPQNEVYIFLREIFLSEYQNELFEMSKNFYDLEYYELLTNKEREIWALEHLKQNNELLGPDKDYLWYQFVNYDLAFQEINKYITVCTDRHKRAAMVNVLIDSVNNEDEIEKLLCYYYESHANENVDLKMSFIDNVVDKKNVFKFDANCWDAFNKILLSTIILSSTEATEKYKTLIILYHIIQDKNISINIDQLFKAVPKDLEKYVMKTSIAEYIKYYKENLYKKLSAEQIQFVYQKFIDLCLNKLILLDTQTYETNKDDARNIIYFALEIMKLFNKNKEDCSDVILKFMKLDSEYFSYCNGDHEFLKRVEITEGKLLRLLKQDSKLVLTKIPDLLLDVGASYWKISINILLNKIKVYFSTDLAKEWLTRCETLILEKNADEYSIFKAIIITIFHIASDEYKIAFVLKYVPEEAKISHDTIDRKVLTIQEGICRFMLYSRPAIPLEYILRYIKGDYVHYCLPMFGSYLSNLPMPLCLEFVLAILSTPVSVQKHGLRLAFECFSIADKTTLTVKIWKSTKNVSLRLTIYKALCSTVERVDENSHRKLYEVLKLLTLDLNENDDDTVFNILTNIKLSLFKWDFLKTAWITVQNLPEQRSKNIQRKCAIIQSIGFEIAGMDKEFCRTQIIDEFVFSMLNAQNIGQLDQNNDMQSLIDAKWKLAAKYMIYIDKDQMDRSLELIHYILQRCAEMWNLTDNGYYTSRKFLFWFINQIIDYTYYKDNKADSLPFLEYIIKILNYLLPMTQIYKLYVKLKLTIIMKKLIGSKVSNYVNLIPEKVANRFATEVIIFLNDLKVKKMLYSSFYDAIGSMICDSIKSMSHVTNLKNIETFKTLVSFHLIEAQLPEADFLALTLLPETPPEDCENVWLDVLGKIQKGGNVELQAYADEFFVGLQETKFGTVHKEVCQSHNYLNFTCQLI